MKTSDEHVTDTALAALLELFGRAVSGKSKFTGQRYVPVSRGCEVVFVRDKNDLTFDEAFNAILDELFGAAGPKDDG